MHIRPTLNSCPAGTEPDGRRRLRASQIRDRRILPRQRLLRRCRDAREAAHSDAVQALPKAIAEYLVGADQRSDLIPAIGSIKVNFTRLDRREGAAVAD